MIDEKLKYDEDLLESYSGKWKNITFTVRGKSYVGIQTHDTEGIAFRISKQAMQEARNQPTRGGFITYECGSRVHYTKISYVIQMPVGEQ